MEMAARKAPTARLRRLGATLKALRTAAGLTQDAAAERVDVDPSSIWRIEAAQNRPHKRTIKDLLTLYGKTTPEEQAPYLELLNRGEDIGWLVPLGEGLSEIYQTFISFEAEAADIAEFETVLIPGLLQTEDHARSILRELLPGATEEYIERRIKVRLHRQKRVTDGSLGLWAVMDEGVIRRTIGGAAVHRAQLAHLLKMGECPNVTLQVVPFSAGEHPGLPGPFLLMNFPDQAAPLAYTENATGGLLIEAEGDVERYRTSFHRIAAVALGPKDTIRMIKELAEATT